MGSGDQRDVRFYTDNIRTFVAVAEHGGLGRAARSMGLSQPSVSQQIARLEALIGRRLYRRGKTGVVLTQDGATLLRHAQAMIEINEAIGRSFGIDGRTVRLNVGLSEMMSLTPLHRVLWLAARQNPGLSLRIVLGWTEMLRTRFEDGAFDVMVGPAPAHTPHPPNVRLLRSEPLVWIGSADAPGPIPDPVPLILPLDSSPLRAAMLTALEGAGRSWDARFEVSSVSIGEAAIDAGFGICAGLQSMPLRGSVHLDRRSGLPDLPSLDYYLYVRDTGYDEVRQAFCRLLTDAVDAA